MVEPCFYDSTSGPLLLPLRISERLTTGLFDYGLRPPLSTTLNARLRKLAERSVAQSKPGVPSTAGYALPRERMLSLQASQGMSQSFVAWLAGKLKADPLEAGAWPAGLDLFVEQPAEVHPTLPKQMLEEGLRLYAEIPLYAEGELVRVLIAATRGSHYFTADEKVLLQAVGHQLRTAIADARLRQEALEAERLVAIGRVAASVAHDLRSSLGGILRSTEFLARSELTPKT